MSASRGVPPGRPQNFHLTNAPELVLLHFDATITFISHNWWQSERILYYVLHFRLIALMGYLGSRTHLNARLFAYGGESSND